VSRPVGCSSCSGNNITGKCKWQVKTSWSGHATQRAGRWVGRGHAAEASTGVQTDKGQRRRRYLTTAGYDRWQTTEKNWGLSHSPILTLWDQQWLCDNGANLKLSLYSKWWIISAFVFVWFSTRQRANALYFSSATQELCVQTHNLQTSARWLATIWCCSLSVQHE